MWGWNPDSFEAVGTVAAAFIAVIALLNGLHDRQSDRKESRALLANQVSVSLLVDKEAREHSDEGTASQAFVLTVTNRGPHPIYRATITSQATATYFWREAPDFTDVFAYPTMSCLYASHELGPKVKWGIVFEGRKTTIEPGETAVLHFGMKDRDPELSVSFRDENGRGWVKYPNGSLVLLRRRPALNRIAS